MPQVSHACKTCPVILTYFQRTNRRIYCKPCKRKADTRGERVNKYLRANAPVRVQKPAHMEG